MNVRELADELEQRFTPFAITCPDNNCDCKLKLTQADWARYAQLMEVCGWLRRQAVAA